MPGPLYFAWIAAPTAFSAGTHAVMDEEIVALKISQSEGDFAALEIEIRNPDVGLLSAGRDLWCWVSWDGDTGSPAAATPLFLGRLVGLPENLHRETVTLLFRAEPEDYAAAQEAVAAGLRDAPFYDRLWLADGTQDEPGAVLEARPAIWDTDRTTLAVTITDITSGEAGTLTFGEDRVLYDATEITFGDPPLTEIRMEATVSWTQTAAGTIDLTQRIWNKFKFGGRLSGYATISTLTGDGLVADWPQPGQTIASGWAVGQNSFAEVDEYARKTYFTIEWYGPDPEAVFDTTHGVYFQANYDWSATFPVYIVHFAFDADYDAKRDRTETVTVTLSADLQPILAQPAGDDAEVISLNSDIIDQPIDDGGALPIGDLRARTFFQSDRGKQAFEHLLLRARARMLYRARAAYVKFQVPFADAVEITCRHNAIVQDRRLHGGGEALGKVVEYALIWGEGGAYAEIKIGCMVGRGGSVSATAGTPVYVEDGVLEPGIQQTIGGTVSVVENELVYQSLDDFALDDDGIDLFNVTVDSVITSITINNTLKSQAEDHYTSFNPIASVRDHPTRICVDFRPLDGTFHTDFTPTVETVPVTKGIDLEAA